MPIDQQNPRRGASTASGKDVAVPGRDRIRVTVGWLIWGAWVLFGVWIASVSVRTLLWDRAMAANAYNSAIHVRPDLAAAWRWQAQHLSLDDLARAHQFAQRACRLNPDNWENWSVLAQIDFQAGNDSEALKALRSAVQVNQGYESHYSLASLLLLMGDNSGFWRQMKAALQLVPDNQVYVAVGQVLRAEPAGLHRGFLSVLPDHPAVKSAAIVALSDKHEVDAALQVWESLRCDRLHVGVCRGAALSLTQSLLEGALPRVDVAVSVWNEAISKGWLNQAEAHFGQIADFGFHQPWLNTGFSWVDNHSARFKIEPGPGFLTPAKMVRVDFDGYEAPGLQVFRQIVPLRSGQQYSLSVYNRRDGTGRQGGLSMQIWSMPQKRLLLELPLDLNATWGKNSQSFQVPADVQLVSVSLEYQRPRGQTLLADPVEIASPQLSVILTASTEQNVARDMGGMR